MVAVALALLALALHLLLAWTFQRLNVFAAKDVLFDADLRTRLDAFSNWYHPGIKHPNLMPYTSPPVTLLAKSLRGLGLVATPEPELRKAIGTLIVPVASAFETAFIFLLFVRLRVGLPRAVLLTTLTLVSFSSLIYGSVPESYGLTALAMALAFLLTTIPAESAHGFRYYTAWILLGVFATGVTISNVAFVAVILWAKELAGDRGRVRATARTAAVAVLTFAITGASAYVLDQLTVAPEDRPVRALSVSGDDSPRSPIDTVERRLVAPVSDEIGQWFDENPRRRLLRFPTSVAQTFAPRELALTRNIIPGPFPFAYTLETTPWAPRLSDPLGLLVLALMVVGTVIGVRSASGWQVVTLGALGVLFGSWLMSMWGREVYLYSQTWHLAAVVLIAAAVKGGGRRESFEIAMLCVLNVAVAVGSATALIEILATIRAAV